MFDTQQRQKAEKPSMGVDDSSSNHFSDEVIFMDSTKQDSECQISKSNVATQRQMLLKRLQLGPVTTLEAREEMNMWHPAGRIFELRKLGFNIETHTCTDLTTGGAVGRVAKYVLVKEG